MQKGDLGHQISLRRVSLRPELPNARSSDRRSRDTPGVSRYEIRRAGTGGVLSKHRTRQAALENWRTLHAGIPITIWRTYSARGDVLVL